MDTSPPSVEYALTTPGLELMPVNRASAEVGKRQKDRATTVAAIAKG